MIFIAKNDMSAYWLMLQKRRIPIRRSNIFAIFWYCTKITHIVIRLTITMIKPIAWTGKLALKTLTISEESLKISKGNKTSKSWAPVIQKLVLCFRNIIKMMIEIVKIVEHIGKNEVKVYCLKKYSRGWISVK